MIGVIDGIEIKFIFHEQMLREYWNFKHRTYCLGSLGVVLPDLRFLYFYSGCPGRMNDQGMWNECPLGKAMSMQQGPIWEELSQIGLVGEEEGFVQYLVPPFLFGDAGFALRPWMVTPYGGEGLDARQQRFNKWFSGIRSSVERAFGILVGRWGILGRKGGLYFTREKSNLVIQVCVALHNFCMERQLEPIWATKWAATNENFLPILDHGPEPIGPVDGLPGDAGKAMRLMIRQWFESNV